MQELFFKYATHGLISGVGVLGLSVIRYLWKIVKLGESNNDLLKQQGDTLHAISKEFRSTLDRIEVHDKLASQVYEKTISSKLIATGLQTFPVFYSKKLREDQ